MVDHDFRKKIKRCNLDKPLNIMVSQCPFTKGFQAEAIDASHTRFAESDNIIDALIHADAIDNSLTYIAKSDNIIDALELLLDHIITSEEIYKEKAEKGESKYQDDKYLKGYFSKE